MLQFLVSGYKKMGLGPMIYCLWAVLAVGFSLAVAGFSAGSITRLLVIAFLLLQIVCRLRLAQVFPTLAPKTRFILLGTILAGVVEGFHMVSTPVFLSLRIGRETSFKQVVINYSLDLLFTAPAYLVIFAVIWWFISRYHYTLWRYIIVMGIGQALGDGGIYFFLGAPAMLFFLPYPTTNYHAINIIPFLATRDELRPESTASAYSYLALPALIGTYFVCGAIIKIAGRFFGLDPG